MSQRSMEVKVGVLILVALGLLGGFVVVMGGLTFQSTYTVYVDFDNPGGLKAGAPVRIAGVRVGRVASIEFRGTDLDPKVHGVQPLIRVVATLENQFRNSVRSNSRWFVTTQGVLGEFYMAVDPGTPDQPVLKDGSIVRGVSPPRLDLLMSEAYELLHRAYVGVTENEAEIREMFDGLRRTLKGSGDFFEKNGSKLDHLAGELDAIAADTHDALLAARAKYVDNPQITRILNDTEGVSSTLNSNLKPLLEDSRKVARDASRLTEALASEDDIQRYETIVRDVQDAAGRAKFAARDVNDLVTHVKKGKGTIGALVMDEAVYDDIQELLRDLKHNPWKLFWKE